MANLLSTSSDCRRWLADDRSDRCEHVEADHNTAYIVYCEDDSFGPLVRNVVCKSCYDKDQAKPAWPGCQFCDEHRTNAEVSQWKWHDFYAPQGDEPYYVCDTCRNENEKFRTMVERDRRQGHEEEIHLGLRCGTCEKYVGSKYFGQQYLCDCDYVCSRCGGEIDKDDVEKLRRRECTECHSKCYSCDTKLVDGTCPKQTECRTCGYLSHRAHREDDGWCSGCKPAMTREETLALLAKVRTETYASKVREMKEEAYESGDPWQLRGLADEEYSLEHSLRGHDIQAEGFDLACRAYQDMMRW